MKYIVSLMLFYIFNLVSQEHENHRDELKLSADILNEIGLSYTKLEKKYLGTNIRVYGEIIPTTTGYSEVGSLISGRVNKMNVQIGDRVKKGDTLFEMVSLELTQLIDHYFSSFADFKRAEKNYGRLKQLKNDGIGSEKLYFEALSEYEKSKARYASEDRKIHALGYSDEEIKILGDAKSHRSVSLPIKAPISGVVSEMLVKNGQFVNNETSLAILLDRSVLWAKLHVYEPDVLNLINGSGVRIRLSGENAISSLGNVVHSSPSLLKNKKTAEVIVALENPENFVMGAQVRATIDQLSGENTWSLPRQSVFMEDGLHFVFIKKQDGEFEKRRVLTGKKTSERIHILSGIDGFDEVVEQGVFYLKAQAMGEAIGGHGH